MKRNAPAASMNIGSKRSWTVRLWRLPRAAGEQISKLRQRIPPQARFLTLCTLLVLLTTLLVSQYTLSSLHQYRPGDIVNADIVVPTDLQVVDQRATAERQRQARDRVAPIFSYDRQSAILVSQQLKAGLEALGLRFRQRLDEEFGADSLTPSQRASANFQRLIGELAAQSEQQPPPFYLKLSPEAVSVLAAENFGEPTMAAIARAAGAAMKRLIYDERDAYLIAASGLQLAPEPGQGEPIKPPSQPLSVAEARSQWASELQHELPRLSRAARLTLVAALGRVITPNLKFDQAATNAERQRAEEMTQPIVVSLKRNRVLLRAGDSVTEEMLPLLEEVRQYQLSARQPQRLAGLFIVVALIYFALYQSAIRRPATRLDKLTTFWVAASAVLFQTALMRVGIFVATALSARSELTHLSDAFEFQLAIPFAACALALSLLLGSQLALIAAMIVSIFAGLVSTGGMAITLYALVSSITAIYSVERYRTRNAITRAILIIGGINISMGAAAVLIANHELTLQVAASAAVLGLLGALLTSAVASIAVPVYESAFNILTDMKLLELSNADLPLLRQLAIQTPGTHHHSFVVGTLAEAAAKAIGANPLLARIGCLYHDIGKLAAPKMYIENQQGGPNPHDRVDPRDSVRIITGHVRRGLKMAHEAKLPPQITDFIPQHHGTRVLSYFYHKAKAQAEARGETVNMSDFRYPGPKPQTKEAVILMLSDAAEAAVRSLEEPTPENIRTILRKIADNIIADGQLDECSVTLHEINAIRESLVNALISIYHQRISYPGFNPPSETGEQGSTAEADGNAPQANEPEPPQPTSPRQVHVQSPH